MDHSGHSGADPVTSTITAVAAGITAMATPAANGTASGMGHGGGGGGMGGSGCKISMLWNWNTIGSCFIARSWKITSNSMFAGSCIGVLFLAISMEMLRRAVKEWDRYLIRKHQAAALQNAQSAAASYSDASNVEPKLVPAGGMPKKSADGGSSLTGSQTTRGNGICSVAKTQTVTASRGYRPLFWEQLVRAFLHVLHFTVAYFIMLLAMYYNGFIIICIFLGTFIGAFIFQWEPLGGFSVNEEVTGCCG